MSETTARQSVPLTPEQSVAVLKLHRAYLQTQLAKLQAGEAEFKAVNEFQTYVVNMDKPEGDWILNSETLSLDPK